MGSARLRVFEYEATGSRSPKLKGTPTQVGKDFLIPVNLASVIKTNALATPLKSAKLDYRTRRSELQLLTSFLADEANAIRLRRTEFSSSAHHIQRFVSESGGLGVLTAVVQACWNWSTGHGPVHNVDVINGALAKQYRSGNGSRPDLLFDFGLKRMLAGEARGRSNNPHRLVTSKQYQRLESLLPWSASTGTPLLMTWAYFTDNETVVDLFVPRDPGGRAFTPFTSETWSGTTNPNVNSLSSFLTPWWPEESNEVRHRNSGPEGTFTMAAQELHRLESELFHSAEEEDSVGFAGRDLRGGWVPTDLFRRGPGRLFLGVLNEQLRPSETADIMPEMQTRYERYSDGWLATRPTVAIGGRIVVVHDPYGATGWDLLRL